VELFVIKYVDVSLFLLFALC